MTEKPPGLWCCAIPRARLAAVGEDPLLVACFALMDDPESGRPRPSLKWLSANLIERGHAARPQTIRRHFSSALGVTFREFVTAAILASARECLSRPGASVKGVWARLGYRRGRGFTRLVVAHLRRLPRSFLPAA